MPRTQSIQNSFVAGEVSPYFLGRTDHDKYKHACEKIYNYIVKTTGGAQRRYGTTYICDAAGPSRLIPFVVDTNLSYELEFGNGILRFFTHHQQIQTSPGVPYQITTPYGGADNLWDIKIAQIASLAYITHPNHPPMKLVRITDTQWYLTQPLFYGAPATEQDMDYSGGTVSISISGNVVTASAPFFIAGDVGRAIVVPNVDTGVGYIASVGGTTGTDVATGATLYQTATITITDTFQKTSYSAGQWLIRGGPLAYFSVGIFAAPAWHGSNKFAFGKTIAVRATTKHPTDASWQTSTGTAYVPVGYAGGFTDSFRTLDNGKYVPFAGGYCQITVVNTSDSINAVVLSVPTLTEANAFGNALIAPTPPGSWWFEGAEFIAGNYPKAVAIFQDRVWFGSTPNNPQRFWGSNTGDYENFAKGTLDTDGIDFTINSGVLDEILWMLAFQGSLVAGTYQGEYLINGGAGQNVQSPGVPITPTNVNVIRQTTFGDSKIQAVLARADVIYVQRNGKDLHEFTYNALTNAYDSKNLNLLAETMATGIFKEVIYQNQPWHTLWCVDTNGLLTGMTYDKTNDVYAWHRQFTGPLQDPIISISVIPSNDAANGQQDDVYLVVQRQRNGVPVYTIETMVDSALNLDCAYHNVFADPVTTISGLGWLAGYMINVVVDGAILPPIIMDSVGIYTFPPGFSGRDVQIGLMYNSELLTVRFERGITQGLIKRWLKIWTRVYQSVNLVINGNQRMVTRLPTEPFNTATPPYTGDLNINNLGFDRDGRVHILQDQPLPSTVLAIFGNVEVSDGV